MPIRANQSAGIAAKQAKSPEVVDLFQKLAARAEAFASMQEEFIAGIIRHRETRTGKPFRYTKNQQKSLDNFDADAAKSEDDMKRLTAQMDDKALLTSVLSGEQMDLQMDETMAPSYPPEDREMAHRMIDFRRETIRIIEEFIENSPFRGQIVSIWRPKKK